MGKLDFVNAGIGTDNVSRFSNGNILPLVSVPHGMASFTIQTLEEGGSWFYHPSHRSFEGIRLTHQPSPWVGDYGHLALMPQTGELKYSCGERWSGFDPEKLELHPHFCSGFLKRDRIRFFFAPTNSGAAFRFDFESDRENRINILPFEGETSFVLRGNALTGWSETKTRLGNQLVRQYFCMEFDGTAKDPLAFSMADRTKSGVTCSSVSKGNSAGISVCFDEKTVECRLATSFLSEEQARTNLSRELAGKTVEQIAQTAADLWEELLSRIDVSCEDPDRTKTFYSCLYRTFLFPRRFYEIDETGRKLHRAGGTGEIVEGVFYTDNGFWDTYRTVYPLYTLIAPELFLEMAEGFLNFCDETGYLPRWISPGETGLMPGTLAEAVLAEAAVKGIGDADFAKRALSAMRKNAEVSSDNPLQGRKCVQEYLRLGYVPRELCRESVNETLDCCYGDFCISQTARAAGEDRTAQVYAERAQNYRKLFDPCTGFMRGLDSDDEMKSDFDPYDWGGEYTEGSAWQASFAVYHDVEGLSKLYGGKEQMIGKLDALFSADPVYRVGDYGFEIHEMSEMSAADFGQCAISNQPSFHLPYLYSLLGERAKTEYWTERIAKEAFDFSDRGFPGDEDNGTTAAWYVFACLGFYPVCPGKDEYVCSKPLFREISLRFRNGTVPIRRFDSNTVRLSDIIFK